MCNSANRKHEQTLNVSGVTTGLSFSYCSRVRRKSLYLMYVPNELISIKPYSNGVMGRDVREGAPEVMVPARPARARSSTNRP